MKLSLDWIKDYVKLPEGLDVSRLMHDLTMSTVEVEGAEVLSKKYKNIVTGALLEVLPHPNADKLRICRTDIGEGNVKEIVCGGINLASGMKVAVALPGSFVRWHGEGEPVEIKETKLRGVKSFGMICASAEMEMFDLFPCDEPGTIVDLSSFDAPPGTPLVDVLGMDDVILEIDNKSMTNRPDLWGHYGIARELSAIYNTPLAPLPSYRWDFTPGGLRIKIEAPDRCARYMGVRIENVSVAEAPFSIRSRIWRVGMRPINGLVDITNYVMLALGQPTHAFDSDDIEGGITVRRARREETLVLLNGRELSLSEEDLVIADDEEAVALAGIMGGNKDSVQEDTTRVILEVANFEPIFTRRTAQRNDLRTEASVRFEKGLNTQRVEESAMFALALFAEQFPEMKVTGFADHYPRKSESSRIVLSLDWLARRMGKRLEDDVVRNMLERLGFSVSISGDTMNVVAPSWRSTGDVSLPEDIMEEVARLYGYENFEQTPIPVVFEGAVNQRRETLNRRMREYLSFRCGMQEIFTYPWMREESISIVFGGRRDMMKLAAPPAPNESRIRSSLLPNLIRAVSENLRYFDEFAIYEMAQVFFDEDYLFRFDSREALPRQRLYLAGALVGASSATLELFRRAKGIVEEMPRFTHMDPLCFESGNQPIWADDTVWMNICNRDGSIGTLSMLSKKSALDAGIKRASVILFEIDVDALTPFASRSNRYEPQPDYPQVEFDISMLFDESVRWRSIEETVLGKATSDSLVRRVRFMDEYRGKQVFEGKKSITFRVVFGSDRKTLTSEEVEKAASAIIKRLGKQLGGEVRGASSECS